MAVHLDGGKVDKRDERNRATKGIWTVALIYRLEAGVIKQLQSWIQMRNLVCDLRTQGNEKTISHLVTLGPSQSSYLTHFEAQCECQEAESTEE